MKDFSVVEVVESGTRLTDDNEVQVLGSRSLVDYFKTLPNCFPGKTENTYENS